MWHWYAAQPNEIFIDCDNWQKCKDHVRRRLMGAIECGRLFVENVFLYPSATTGHMHIIIVLDERKTNLNAIEKAVWEIIFHSDIYRGCANIMRANRHSNDREFACDVLISPQILHRRSDTTCNCNGKHKYKVMEKCPAAYKLRGNARVESFFGKPSDKECPWF